ncbi:hypothetical protein, partial [Xanthomonas citri]|uniref:hypothetical protein n=1 Tax=Xanthomonas citri TaxID=346 RepID=UPI0019D6D8DF
HQEMDAADPRLEGCAEPLYDPVRGATSSAVTQTTVTQNSAHAQLVGEEAFFSFKSGDAKFALSPTDQYFMSGIAAFKGLTHLLVDRLFLPSRALVRVFSTNTSFGEWIATPLVIYDAE